MITYTGLHCPKTIYGSHSWQINMYPCILYNQLQATSKLHIQLLLQKNICTCNVGKPCSPYKRYQDCKIHISGRTVYLRGRLYLLVFSYLDFEVYNYFITIYVHVFVYMQRDLLLMQVGNLTRKNLLMASYSMCQHSHYSGSCWSSPLAFFPYLHIRITTLLCRTASTYIRKI